MKVAAIVTVFHPDLKLLSESLNSYQASVDKILIWKNSKEEISISDQLAGKIVFCGTGDNEYMAHPLNYAINWCLNNGYDYLLTMDQDSVWHNCADFILRVSTVLNDKVAIYAPNVNRLIHREMDYLAVESVITSGSLCNVQIANELGGFREDYQIYWVDSEYCCWARKNGYEIVVLPQCHLTQQFGKETKTILGYMAANYSPAVYYFLIRNMWWMKREYHDNPSWKCILYTTFYYTRGIVLGEKMKLKKLSMIIKAYRDGIFCSMKKRK